jgi:hypothetical protein
MSNQFYFHETANQAARTSTPYDLQLSRRATSAPIRYGRCKTQRFYCPRNINNNSPNDTVTEAALAGLQQRSRPRYAGSASGYLPGLFFSPSRPWLAMTAAIAVLTCCSQPALSYRVWLLAAPLEAHLVLC